VILPFLDMTEVGNGGGLAGNVRITSESEGIAESGWLLATGIKIRIC